MINHFTYSAFLIFLLSLPIGVYFVLTARSTAQRFFGFFWLTVCFWTCFVSLQSQFLRLMPEHIWGFFLHIGCIYVPLIYFHFALHLTGTRKQYDLFLKMGYALMATFLILIVTSRIFTGEIIYRASYAYPKPSLLYPVYIIFFQVFGFFGAFLIFKWALSGLEEIRWVVFVFILLQIFAHIGSMDNYLIMYDINWFPLYPHGLYLILPYLFFGVYFVWVLRSKRIF